MTLNKRERVLRALDKQEPDRVPMTELDIEVQYMEAITGEKCPASGSLQTQVISDKQLERKRTEYEIKCYDKLDFDAYVIDLSAPEDWKPQINPDGTMVDLWGRVLIFDPQTKAWVPYSTIFNTPANFRDFQLPNHAGQGWTFAIELARRLAGEDIAVAAFIRDPFAQAWEMFTPLSFVKWMYQDPEFIREVIAELTEFNVKIIEQIADAEADFIVSGGDYCEQKGPMVPLKLFDEVILPNLKKQVESAHKRGLKLIKHTDGNVNPLLDRLADVVDGLHSLDSTAGVDIGDVKNRYGDKFVLIGNVAVDSLARKGREEVVEETKNCIRKASPGGGHILSSSNSWAAGARLENCLAMVEAGKKYGTYPIRL